MKDFFILPFKSTALHFHHLPMGCHLKKSLVLIFFLLSIYFPLFATHTLNLAHFPAEAALESHPLLAFHNQLVQVRGFWYPISSDQGILSAHSGLKSCCLKTPDKLHQQLLVKGQLLSLPAQRVITLEGIFKIEPRYDQEGQLVQFYILDQAREVQQATSYALLLILGFFLVLLCLWRFFLQRRQA
jgi:hypothetical protein